MNEENKENEKKPSLKPLKWYYIVGIVLFAIVLFSASLHIWKIKQGDEVDSSRFVTRTKIDAPELKTKKSTTIRDGDLVEFIAENSESCKLVLYVYKFVKKDALTGLGFAVLTGFDKENRQIERRTNVVDTDVLRLVENEARSNRVPVYNEIVKKSGFEFNPLWIFYICFIGIFIFIIRRNTAHKKEFAENMAHRQHYSSIKPRFEKSDIKFENIGGLKTAKNELLEIIDYLKNRDKYIEVGCELPKGVLLSGPPGCGKTLLAKAVSCESGVPVACVSGSEFVEALVGVGAGRVRQLFDEARKRGDGIIFIDEFDALAGQRGASANGGNDEKEQTVNQLLASMDGIGTAQNIMVVAATNRPDMLDSAVLRPGRFDRKIECGMPDMEERKEILGIHLKGKKVAQEVTAGLDRLSKICWSFSGAYIKTMINEAAFLAVRKGKKIIGIEEMEEGRRRVFIGAAEEGKIIPTLEEKMVVCAHEAGHLVASYFSEGANPALEISCIRRKSVRGYTLNIPKDKSDFMWRKQLLAELPVALAGRAAEELLFDGNYTAGYENDFGKAHSLARSMVGQLGMDEKLGVTVLSQRAQDNVFLGRNVIKDASCSEMTRRKIDKRVGELVDDAMRKAKKIVRENVRKLLLVALAVREKEVLYEDEIRYLVNLSDEEVELELKKINDLWVNEKISKTDCR